MADRYDHTESDGNGGSGFLFGLFAGAAIGAGLGMLFAPKTGAQLRSQLSQQAGELANTASKRYQHASEVAGEFADRGRDMYDQTRHAVSRGVDEAQQAATNVADRVYGGANSPRV